MIADLWGPHPPLQSFPGPPGAFLGSPLLPDALARKHKEIQEQGPTEKMIADRWGPHPPLQSFPVPCRDFQVPRSSQMRLLASIRKIRSKTHRKNDCRPLGTPPPPAIMSCTPRSLRAFPVISLYIREEAPAEKMFANPWGPHPPLQSFLVHPRYSQMP